MAFGQLLNLDFFLVFPNQTFFGVLQVELRDRFNVIPTVDCKTKKRRKVSSHSSNFGSVYKERKTERKQTTGATQKYVNEFTTSKVLVWCKVVAL